MVRQIFPPLHTEKRREREEKGEREREGRI
jgi:hypothetical protein